MSDEAEPEKEIGLSVPEGAISRELLIINKRGLHARASAKFVQMVERFNAEVFVTRGNETVGGTSIMGLMMLAAGPGTTVTVAADGPDAQAAVANFRNTLLDRYVAWSILRAAPRTEASFAATWRFLREQPDWPEPEVLRRQAEERIGPETPASEVVRYFTAFPPLTSTGHMRRLEAASTAAPNEVARFARDTSLAMRSRSTAAVDMRSSQNASGIG